MSGGMSAQERGDLAEALLPEAAGLAVAVREETAAQIGARLAGLDRRELEALAVVLAAMVDPDRSLTETLSWVDFDEHGAPLPAPAASRRPVVPVRGVARELPAEDGLGVDEVAVELYLSGARPVLSSQDRLAAILEGQRRGMALLDIDRAAGLREGSSCTFLARARKAAEARGEVLPEAMERQGRRFSEAEVVSIRERVAAGETDLEVALSVGVARATVSRIVSGEAYPDFGGPRRAAVTPAAREAVATAA